MSSPLILSEDQELIRDTARELVQAKSPVKEMRRTIGWLVRAVPHEAGPPVTTLKTPSGSPASARTCANSSSAAEACSDGFRTMVLPAARAGAILNAPR